MKNLQTTINEVIVVPRVLVIYKSKYKSAERYARWISEELGSELVEASRVDRDKLEGYDVIIFGGSLYAVGIIGLSVIKENFDKIKAKKVVIFSVGASPANPETLQEVKSKNFTAEMLEKVEYYHFRGAFDFKKLNLIDKILMFFLKLKLQLKKTLSNDEKGMLAAYKTPVDWTNKKAIAPLVESVKEFIKSDGAPRAEE